MKLRLLLLLTVFYTVNAAAEKTDSTAVDSATLNEVSVVGFYRNPGFGVTYGNQEITKMNKGQDPSYIFDGMPGVFSYSDAGNGFGYAYFRLRGMDQTRINATLDGMPLAEPENMGAYFTNYPDMLGSMHSVKVENGSSVSNSGTTAMAGNVSFETADLDNDTVSSVYVGAGLWNTYKIASTFNSGRLPSGWALHVKGTMQTTDGYRHNAYNRSQSLFAKIGYRFNSAHSIDFLTFIGNSRNGQAYIGLTDDEMAINRRTNGCSDKEIDHFVQNINKLQYNALFSEHVKFTASAYFNFLNGHYYFDLDNYLNRMVYPVGADKTYSLYNYRLRHNMWGATSAISATYSWYKLTAGFNGDMFARRHVTDWNYYDCNFSLSNIGKKNEAGVFAKNLFVTIPDRLFINVDLEYRHADYDITNVDFDKINWNFLNLSAGTHWAIRDGHDVRFRYTLTHREPTRSDMFINDSETADGFNPDVKREVVSDFELSYDFAYENTLHVNANAYMMVFTDALVNDGTINTAGLLNRTNVNGVKRYGLETSVTYAPFTAFKLRNYLSLSKNTITSDGDAYNLTFSPSITEKACAEYTVGKFGVSCEYAYRSRMYVDLANKYSLRHAGRLNIGASYKFGQCTASVDVYNVLNSKTCSNGAIGINAAGTESLRAIPDAPISFIASIRVNL